VKRLALGAVLVVALAACGGNSSTGSPGASASSAHPSDVAPSDQASAEASQAASPTASEATGIQVGSLATVVTNDLRVRSKPSVGSDSVKYKPLLDKGRLVYVAEGPKKGSGYTWYRVQPVGRDADDDPLPFGWVAAADKDGTPWLGEAPPCPGTPGDFASLAHTNGLMALACYGGKKLTFPARLLFIGDTCPTDIEWRVKPDWFNVDCPSLALLDPDTDELITPAFHPQSGARALGSGTQDPDPIPVTVTGLFDHPAAKTCKGVPAKPSSKVPSRAEIILGCRTTFAVTAIEPRR
jgi:hypothetical protein